MLGTNAARRFAVGGASQQVGPMSRTWCFSVRSLARSATSVKSELATPGQDLVWQAPDKLRQPKG